MAHVLNIPVMMLWQFKAIADMVMNPDRYQAEGVLPSTAGFVQEDELERQAVVGIISTIAAQNGLDIASLGKITWGTDEQWYTPGEQTVEIDLM